VPREKRGRKGEKTVTEEFKTRQTEEVTSGHAAATVGASRNDGTESSRPRFNKYIYENFLCHIEGQIEHWNRMAVRQSNPDAAHDLWLKAEGLGYALRLLFTFKPEFDELNASAMRTKCNGCGAELENRPNLPSADAELCDSCYEIAHDGDRTTADVISANAHVNDTAATLAEGSVS
jgi:hypothetical protein